jgi:hypothetical protein
VSGKVDRTVASSIRKIAKQLQVGRNAVPVADSALVRASDPSAVVWAILGW